MYVSQHALHSQWPIFHRFNPRIAAHFLWFVIPDWLMIIFIPWPSFGSKWSWKFIRSCIIQLSLETNNSDKSLKIRDVFWRRHKSLTCNSLLTCKYEGCMKDRSPTKPPWAVPSPMPNKAIRKQIPMKEPIPPPPWVATSICTAQGYINVENF